MEHSLLSHELGGSSLLLFVGCVLVMGTIIGDYIGTTIGIHSPRCGDGGPSRRRRAGSEDHTVEKREGPPNHKMQESAAEAAREPSLEELRQALQAQSSDRKGPRTNLRHAGEPASPLPPGAAAAPFPTKHQGVVASGMLQIWDLGFALLRGLNAA